MAGVPKSKKALFGLALLYSALIALALLLERPNDLTEFVYRLFSGGGDCKGREETNLQFTAFPYKLISNAYSKPGELKVRIVTFERGSEPSTIFGNEASLCRQRIFLAKLIQRLQQLSAKSIVIDKYFNPTMCDSWPPGPQNGTDELKDVISKTSIPITLGLHTNDVGGLAGKSRQIKTCLILADAMRFGSRSCSKKTECIQEGVIRLNSDTRRIPINWEVFESERDAEQNATPRLFNSLSVVAAKQSDPQAEAGDRLAKLLTARDPSHPFMSFREIPQFRARQVLCGVDFPENAGANWEQMCSPPNIQTAMGDNTSGKLTNKEIADAIRDQTVIIGEINDQDVHNSINGDVPGVVLQANYIQALLEGRYLPAVSGWISFVCYCAWFALTFISFAKKSPGVAYIWSASALILLIALSFAVVKYFGRIFPWGLETVISGLAVGGIHWAYARGHKVAIPTTRNGGEKA
jgi:CHASE2 domain